jgi:hypothetical protein
MGKKIGIWLDSDQAVIIENGTGKLNRVESEVEHYHLHGGNKGGGTATSSDTKLLKRKNNQFKNYFNGIIKHVSNAESIVVFGPAETKVAFKRELEQSNEFKNKLRAVESADKMTDNQLIEWVWNYYS